MTQVLEPLSFPLRGSRLIEASAGTGKTWTIAALYVRLVLGHGGPEAAPVRALMPPDILVMTFTRAATRELSDRIRARLTEAAQVFRQGPEATPTRDPFLSELLQAYPHGQARAQAGYRLALAAQAMDDAAIYTIDAWCQRMLREHAFDSGNLFEESLVADEAALRLEAVQDYWREALYPLPPDLVGEVLAVWPDVQALEQELRPMLAADLPLSAQTTSSASLAEVLLHARQAQRQALAALKQGWDAQADALRDWLDDTLAAKDSGWNKRSLSRAHYSKWLQALKEWALGEGGLKELKKAMGDTAWRRFTPAGMAECRAADAPAAELPAQCQASADL